MDYFALSEDARATLTLFGWVVVETHEGGSLVVGDEHSGWWLTTAGALNGAALSLTERIEVMRFPLGDQWEAHDDWCQSWTATRYTGGE